MLFLKPLDFPITGSTFAQVGIGNSVVEPRQDPGRYD